MSADALEVMSFYHTITRVVCEGPNVKHLGFKPVTVVLSANFHKNMTFTVIISIRITCETCEHESNTDARKPRAA